MARSATVDPLEKFRFRLTWSQTGDGSEPSALARAGFHDIQMPKRSTTKGTYREGTDRDIPQLFAGLSSMEDIVLSRGVISLDSETQSDLYAWMSSVHSPSGGNNRPGATADGTRPAGAAANAYRKDVTIEMLDREGVTVRAWRCYQAWPMNFVPGSDLNAAEDGEKSLEQLTLAYEDFQELKVDGGTVQSEAKGE